MLFDGSSHLGEALVILLRFISDGWEIVQRLIRLCVVGKSLNAQQLAREVVTCLATGYHLPPGSIVVMVQDGAAANSYRIFVASL